MEKQSKQESEMCCYFLAPTEAVISNEITDLFISGKQITESIIREKARFHFYRPHILAERALYREYSIERENVYTQDFIQEAQAWASKVSELILDENAKLTLVLQIISSKNREFQKNGFLVNESDHS